MKRFHVHVGVVDLEQSIRFYSCLFGAEPTLRKTDYAKWMVDDPRLNFAISSRGGRAGVNHLGLQVDDSAELACLRERFSAADASTVVDEPGANCCYARSDKHWVTDPQGIAWEGYHTLDGIRTFGSDGATESETGAQACCASEPTTAAVPESAASCCAPAPMGAVAAASGASCCAPSVAPVGFARSRAA